MTVLTLKFSYDHDLKPEGRGQTQWPRQRSTSRACTWLGKLPLGHTVLCWVNHLRRWLAVTLQAAHARKVPSRKHHHAKTNLGFDNPQHVERAGIIETCARTEWLSCKRCRRVSSVTRDYKPYITTAHSTSGCKLFWSDQRESV